MKARIFDIVFKLLIIVLLTLILITVHNISIKTIQIGQASHDYKLPAPEMVNLEIEDRPYIGDEYALVELIVFTDFTCPFCYDFFQQIESIKDEYINSGLVKLVFMNYPLGNNLESMFFARVAEYAYTVDKFEDIYNLLFNYKKQLVLPEFYKYMSNHIEDTTALKEFVSNPNIEIERCIEIGNSINLRGVPAFVIENMLYVGIRSDKEFKQILDEAIIIASSICD